MGNENELWNSENYDEEFINNVAIAEHRKAEANTDKLSSIGNMEVVLYYYFFFYFKISR